MPSIVRSWEHIDDAYRAFLARAIDALIPKDGNWWQARVLASFRNGPPRGSCLADLELSELCHLIGHNGRRTRDYDELFGKQLAPGFITLAFATRDARNRQVHDKDVGALTQLTDLLLVHRAAECLYKTLPKLAEEDEEFQQTLYAAIARYLPPAAEAVFPEVPPALRPDAELREAVGDLTDPIIERLQSIERAVANLQIPARPQPALIDDPASIAPTPLDDVRGMLTQLVTMTRHLQATQRQALSVLADLLLAVKETHRSTAAPAAPSSTPTNREIPASRTVNSGEYILVQPPSPSRPSPLPPLSPVEARDKLIALRETIVARTPGVPREAGILRRSMLDYFVARRVATKADLQAKIPAADLSKTAKEHLSFLPEIFAITGRIRGRGV